MCRDYAALVVLSTLNVMHSIFFDRGTSGTENVLANHMHVAGHAI